MNESIPPTSPPTSPTSGPVSVVAAGLLNWLWAGAGYFVIGQQAKAILFCILTLILLSFAILTCGLGVVIFVPYVIITIVDVVLLAQRINRGEKIAEWQFF
jgi:hypothetical protein